MAKPSIFSRDYEKIMRKRKRKIISLFGVLILIISVLIIRYNMQKINATFKSIAFNKDFRLSNIKPESINIALDDNNLTLRVIGDNDNQEIIDVVSEKALISSDIKKDKALIIDEDQRIYLLSTQKEVIDLTLNQYISANGESTFKRDILNNNSNYLWHTQGKIINNDTVAYVTNIPSFEGDLKQSIALVTIKNNIHAIKEDLKGNSINLYESDKNYLKVEIDGNIMYISIEETNY